MTVPDLALLERCSRYGQRLLLAQPALAEATRLAFGQAFTRDAMLDFLNTPACTDEDSLHRRLRQLRQRVWLIVTARDLAGLADLAEVTAAYTALAEVCIATALDFHHAGSRRATANRATRPARR